MNNKKHSIGEKEVAVMGWTNIDVYHPAVVTGLLIVFGSKVLHGHSLGLALVKAQT